MHEIKKMLFNGTDEEFRSIVESYQLLLYSVVYAASAYAEADDIVQETFIYAYYHWGMLREKEKLSAWLCAIAKNKAARVMKKRGKTVSLDTVEEKIQASSPESAVLRRERNWELHEKIDQLSEKYKEPLMLYYFAGKSISEISMLLDIPEGTVKFRLYEGRKRLKKELFHVMREEKKHMEKKDIWSNIKSELQRAADAFKAYQRGDANAICDRLIELFQKMEISLLSEEEILLMIHVYIQKYYANMHLESRDKNIVYIQKCAELAELSGHEGFMLDAYSFYASTLSNLGQHKDALLYYQKAQMLAEKLKLVPQMANLNYWMGTEYLASDDHKDVQRAKVYFEKAVSEKDKLLESDYGKYIYALAYAAFTAMNRTKDIHKLDGFYATSPVIFKNENGLQLQEQPGFCMGKYSSLCIPDVFAYITNMKPFLSNDICEGYAFEQDTFSRSKIPVHSRYEVISMNANVETPARIFENCLHIRYIDQTEEQVNFKRNGVRDMFYAPNVGLVMMHFKAIADWEYTVKLSKYSVISVENGNLCDRYLPLTIGNVWYYESYGADGTHFDQVDYENRFEVMTKRKNGALISIAHSGWICKRN